MKKLNLLLFLFMFGLVGTMFGQNKLNVHFSAENGGTVTGVVKVNGVVVAQGTATLNNPFILNDIPVSAGDIIDYHVTSDELLFDCVTESGLEWMIYNSNFSNFNIYGYPIDYAATNMSGTYTCQFFGDEYGNVVDFGITILYVTIPHFTDVKEFFPLW